MTTQAEDLGTSPRSSASVSSTNAGIGGVTFDWVMIGACAWLMAGAYLDAWAHRHFQLETFFTPWHGVLYSGFLVVALVLLGTVLLNHARGVSWYEAIPAGYELSVFGIFGFALGGIADMFWHILFGIEGNIDAQFSPTHVLLMICFGLISAGPFRAAWRRSTAPAKPQWITQLTIPASLLLLLSVFSLTTQTVHPFTSLAPTSVVKTQYTEQSLAVVGIVFQGMILTMLSLLAVRRWRLPVGSFTLVLTLNALCLSFMNDTYVVILIAVIAGGLIDIVYYLVQPSEKRVEALRLFACAVPVILYLVYFLTLWITRGIVWSVHLSVGSIVVSGVAGWLISYMLIPPTIPADRTPVS